MNTPEVKTWDNWKKIVTDYNLSDFWEVSDIIRKMPKLDLVIHNYSQYKEIRYYTGCTAMWAINAIATIENYDFTRKEISEVYDIYEDMWWKPWKWWARGAWLNAVYKRWNNRFPDNKMMYFLENIFSDATTMVLDKLGIIWVSIRVDSAYWKDVRQDLRLDENDFITSIWHATTCMRPDEYICADSVPRSNLSKDVPMLYTYWDIDMIKKLIKSNNFRSDIHIIVMEKRLNEEISEEEKTRLETYKEKLETVIACNSEMRHLTTQDKDKKRLRNENIYNRGKLKVILWLLWA